MNFPKLFFSANLCYYTGADQTHYLRFLLEWFLYMLIYFYDNFRIKREWSLNFFCQQKPSTSSIIINQSTNLLTYGTLQCAPLPADAD
jgi:hypothetical protein